jgi:hypothetical protein
VLVLSAPAVAGCGARSPLNPPEACLDDPPICVVDGAGCDPATVADAVCSATTHRWSCPAPARIYERAPSSGEACLPFSATPGLSRVGSWGLGSLARVPTDDGRCLWVADSAVTSDGTTTRNVAFEADRRAPFGSCPTTSIIAPTPIVTIEGEYDPTLLVQITNAYRLGGKTRVLYRLFRQNPSSTFGVDELGGGIARWDAATQRIVIPSPKTPFAWGLDLDLGDAVLPAGDDTHAYVWGCGLTGGFLLQSCRLARVDTSDGIELFGFGDSFIKSTRATDGPSVFESSHWMSSVVPVPGGYRHVYVVAFGTELQSQVASSPLGPWTAGPSLGRCGLPGGDDKAWCAGPIAHLELADPTRPGELPIAYGVGTTTPVDERHESYATRLVWVH